MDYEVELACHLMRMKVAARRELGLQLDLDQLKADPAYARRVLEDIESATTDAAQKQRVQRVRELMQPGARDAAHPSVPAALPAPAAPSQRTSKAPQQGRDYRFGARSG